MSGEVRIVGATVVPHPDAVLPQAEVALSQSSGLITYLGASRGPVGRSTSTDGGGSVSYTHLTLPTTPYV